MVTTTPSAGDAPVFVDTNVLVYGNITSSPFYVVARDRLGELKRAGTPLWISRQVIREYVVTLTRGQAYATPVPPADAAAAAEDIAAQFSVVDETANVTHALLSLVRRFDIKGRQVHDANVVATMTVHGARRLLTHNVADFKRYEPLIEILPLEK